MTRGCAFTLAVLSLALPGPAAGAEPGIEAEHDSPLGRVRITAGVMGPA